MPALGLNKVLFVLNGLPPKLMVVDIKTNKVEVQHELPAPSMTDKKTVHGQFRRVRYTAQGTYLVPFLEMNEVTISTSKRYGNTQLRAPGPLSVSRTETL
jgi:hypothetical protein